MKDKDYEFEFCYQPEKMVSVKITHKVQSVFLEPSDYVKEAIDLKKKDL